MLCLLGGCMPPSPRCAASQRVEYLQQLQTWQIEGRIAINKATESVNAAFTWEQDQDKYRIHFTSPYTTESLTISGDANGFNVTANNGEAEPEVQLEQNLPFKQLSAWLKGIPAANSTPQNTKYDASQQLQSMQQDGWLIEYQNYLLSSPYPMPGKLIISNGTTKAKLLIKNWQK